MRTISSAALTASLTFRDGHARHEEQGNASNRFRRYIIWRNNHAYERLRRIIDRANVA
jgi:hypothetical protein